MVYKVRSKRSGISRYEKSLIIFTKLKNFLLKALKLSIRKYHVRNLTSVLNYTKQI